MSAQAVEAAPVTSEQATSEEDCVHVTCCADEDLALCGEDISNEPWIEGTPDDADCSNCVFARIVDTCPRTKLPCEEER